MFLCYITQILPQDTDIYVKNMFINEHKGFHDV